jgi:hypothetical protein
MSAIPTNSRLKTQGNELIINGSPATFAAMTELLEQAIESVRELPDEAQDALARMLLQFAGVGQPVVDLSAEDAASFDESLAQAERGKFASDAEVRAIWAKHGL